MGHVTVDRHQQSRDIWYFLTAVVVSSMDTRSRIHKCKKDRNPIEWGQGLHEEVCELAVASSIRVQSAYQLCLELCHNLTTTGGINTDK